MPHRQTRMLRVYVAGPISATDASTVFRNVGRMIEVGTKLFFAGTSPFVPALNYHFSFSGKESNDYYYTADNVWLDVSDVVVLCKGWRRSKGARAEKERAEAAGIPVYTTVQGFVCALRRGSVRPRVLVEKEGT